MNPLFCDGSSGPFGSLGFNEADFSEDVRLYSQELATGTAVLPPQRHRWIEGSTSCTPRGDIMSSTVSVEFERSLEQRSFKIPTCAEESPGEENYLELCPPGEENYLELFPPPLQHEQSSHSPQPVATSATSIFSDLSLFYHEPSRTNDSDEVLPLSSSSQRETLERTLFPSHQPSTSGKSRFHFETLVRDRVLDSAVVNVSRGLGAKQHNFMQQELQKPMAKPAPRKYRRSRVLKGIDKVHDEVDGGPTPDHVQRERRRRDLMTSRVAALELLLPKGTTGKRDRLAIVEDTIQLLKRLERDVKDLQQKFHKAKLRRAGHKQSREPNRLSIPKSIDCNMESIGSYFSNGIVIKRMGTYMKPVAIRTQPTRVTSGRSRPTHLSYGTECLGESNVVDKRNVFVEFHVHLDDNVTVQEKILKCHCRMDYLRRMIGVVDEFQLDLTTCNIMKISGYFICIMRLKARRRIDMMSADQFALRLQSMIDANIDC